MKIIKNHSFSGQTSYYESLGFTNTPQTREAAEKEAVTWTGFTEGDIIERIHAIFTSELNDKVIEDIKSLVGVAFMVVKREKK